jgi:hypothetical protein
MNEFSNLVIIITKCDMPLSTNVCSIDPRPIQEWCKNFSAKQSYSIDRRGGLFDPPLPYFFTDGRG